PPRRSRQSSWPRPDRHSSSWLAALRQHLLGVLAQAGNALLRRRHDAVDLEQRAEQLHLPCHLMLDAVNEPIGPNLVMLVELIEQADLGRGHARGTKPLDPDCGGLAGQTAAEFGH